MIASPVLTEPGTINQRPPFLRAENVVIFSPVCSGPPALDESFVGALDLDLIEWLQNVRASATKLDQLLDVVECHLTGRRPENVERRIAESDGGLNVVEA